MADLGEQRDKLGCIKKCLSYNSVCLQAQSPDFAIQGQMFMPPRQRVTQR